MKKNLFGITGLLLVAMALTACGGGSSAKAGSSSEQSSAAVESSASDAGASEASVKAGGSLTVGFDQEFPPMGFVGADGQYTGYDLALAEEVAKRLGLEFKAQPINWDAKDMELESGNIDCIWNGFTMQGREDAYTWVGPYMANNQVFVVNEDSDIMSLSDLKGRAVEVQKDSSGLAALRSEENAELTGGFAMLTEVADYNTALMDLESGAADAVCMDSVVAGYQITSSGKAMRILEETLSAEEYGVGFKKGDEALAKAVEDTLRAMQEDGIAAKISEEWFGDSTVFTLK